jgi:Tfp pilus assembly protein PilN
LENISLLPPEIRTRQEARRRSTLYVLASGLAVLFFLGVYGGLFVATWQAKGETRSLAASRSALEAQMAGLKVYADMQARVNRAEGLVHQAKGAAPDWGGVLEGVGRELPEGVWLTDFTAAYKAQDAAPAPSGTGAPAPAPEAPGAGELTMRGWALNHLQVAEWLDAVRSVPGLADVRGQFSSLESHEGRPAVQFEIKARVEPVEPGTAGAAAAGGGG